MPGISSDRNQGTSFHLTVDIKEAARKEALRRGMSLSRLLAEYVEKQLCADGVDIVKYVDPSERELPLEPEQARHADEQRVGSESTVVKSA